MKTILVDAAYTFVDKEGNIFEEMHNLLEEFPNKKIILTNANDEEMITYGLDKVPYEVFTLKHSPNKVDPEYYEKMLSHFDLSKEDVIYFEHSKEAVESAKSLGINTYHYDSEKRDLESLKKFIEENI